MGLTHVTSGFKTRPVARWRSSPATKFLSPGERAAIEPGWITRRYHTAVTLSRSNVLGPTETSRRTLVSVKKKVNSAVVNSSAFRRKYGKWRLINSTMRKSAVRSLSEVRMRSIECQGHDSFGLIGSFSRPCMGSFAELRHLEGGTFSLVHTLPRCRMRGLAELRCAQNGDAFCLICAFACLC